MNQSIEVRTEGLRKQFGDVHAVKDVNLHIAKGEFYTFLGPSGCGKTTLLRILAGFTSADSGSIYFDDQFVNDIPPWKRNVGMVFQNYALWPHMNVFENIAFGLRERKIVKSEIQDRVERSLQMVNLEGLDKRRPSQLSGGQQQRVALARTLVTEPGLLLLDEPLSNLDAKLRIQMREELLRLQRELGITTIYVTHDQEEALITSTRIAVMSEGKIIQEGTPKEIYELPYTKSVADFVGTSNLFSAEIIDINEDMLILSSDEIQDLQAVWQNSLSQPPSIGSPIEFNIRPELIRFSKGGITTNRISGKVESTAYLGSQIQYMIAINENKIVRVNTLNSRKGKFCGLGEAVELTFSPHDITLLHS
ncbi:TPA: ABC transporter ATP-binding protein [Candidatus Poribacteria bacterium]|nr:ABC transporter ATP-binding protein [Candidatus Poribacteria bacterium]HIO09915.1 ABC transporter ATP-binding protein [Candidatus Poribacteria bacterium]HIO78489.1 ABC transporter ATP-binding protein [Candidatus Poribacteria bacterium]